MVPCPIWRRWEVASVTLTMPPTSHLQVVGRIEAFTILTSGPGPYFFGFPADVAACAPFGDCFVLSARMTLEWPLTELSHWRTTVLAVLTSVLNQPALKDAFSFAIFSLTSLVSFGS